MAQLQSTGITGSLNVTGTVTAQEFHTEFISGSIIFVSGSTKFGDTSNDIHSFSGSLQVSGSGNHFFTDGNVGIGTSSPTASLHVEGVGYFDGGENISFSDTVTDAAIVIRENDFIYTRDGNNLRRLIGKDNSDVIHIGATGTSLIDEIRLLPGTTGGKTTFYDSSTQIMVVSGSGVGIGTSSPGSKLTISGGTNTDSEIRLINTAPATDNDWFITPFYNDQSLRFRTNAAATTVLTMLDSGNVGIGTTTPGNVLHVSSSNNTTPVRFEIGENANYYFKANSTSGYATTFNMDDTGLDIGHNSSGRSLNLQTNSTDRLTISGDGRVGIGTVSPSNPLSVEATNASDWVAEFKQGHSTTGQSYGVNIQGGTNASDASFQASNQSGTTLFRVRGDGSVGIGNTSLTGKLSVEATGNHLFLRASTASSGKYWNFDVTSNNQLFFLNNDSSASFTIKDDNTVGIGTSSPTSGNRLHIKDSDTQIELEATGSGTSNSGFVNFDGTSLQLSTNRDNKTGTFHDTAKSNASVLIVGSDGGSHIRFNTAAANNTTSTERMRIDSSGQVYFKSSTDFKIGLNDSAGVNQWWIKSPTDGDFVIHENGVGDQLTISAGGNVGIGIHSPDDKLHVSGGNVRITNASPAISFYDTDVSGLYHKIQGGGNKGLEYQVDPNNATAGYHRFDIGGSELMRLIEGGNLGLGTSSPSTALHIDQPSNNRAGGLYLETQGQDYGLSAFVNSGGYGIIGSNGSFTTDIITMNLNNGSVGLGAASAPNMQLHISHSDQDGLRFSTATNAETFIDFGDTDDNDAGSIRYDHADNSLAFRVNASERMRIDSGGNAIFTKSGGAYLQLKDASAVRGAINVETSDGLVFTTGASFTERMRIDSSGKVGIGVTSPIVPFHVKGANISNPSNGSGGNETMQVFDTTSLATGVGGGIGLGGIFNSSGTDTVFSEIRGIKENSTDGNYAGALTFSTRTNGASITERMRITSDGDIQLSGSTLISTNTSDAADSAQIIIAGGGASGDARGASVHIAGNEHANGGLLQLRAGDSTNSQIRYYTGGEEQMRLTSSGRLGIGTSSPSSILHLEDASSPSLIIKDTTNDVTFKAYAQNTNAHIATTSNHDLFIDTNNTSRITVLKDGKVGIGTTTPAYAFQLHGDAAFLSTAGSLNGLLTQGAEGNGRLYLYEAGSATIGFQTSGSSYINSGNVGIGIATPAKQLEILYPSYIDKDTVEGLLRLTGQSNTENSAGEPSAGVGIEFYNKWQGGSAYSMGRISARGEQSYNGGLQFDVSDNTAPGQDNFTTAMSIDAEARVGIGTTSPGTVLDIHGTGNVLHVGTGTNVAQYMSFRGSGASGAFIGYDGTGMLLQPGDGKRFLIRGGDENWGQGNVGLLVDTDGNVGIGTTSPASISSTAHWLTLNADNGSSASGGVIYQVDGTTKAATYAFGDNVYHDAKAGVGHQFAVDNGTVAMAVNSNGRVGIGTTSASGVLHVKGDTNGNGAELFLQINNNNTTDTIGAIHFGNNADSTLSSISSFTSGNNTTSHLVFSVSDSGTQTSAMRILSSGNVGIGTTSPEAKLEVTDGNSSIRLQEFNNGAAIFLDGSNGDFAGSDYFHMQVPDETRLSLGHVVTEILSVTSGSRVGISTTSPESKLHVKQSANTYQGGLTLERSDSTAAWQIYTDGSSNLDFNQGASTRGYLVSGASVSNIDFTGQHRSLISTTNDNTAGYTDDELVGLIVVSDGTYSNISGSSTSPQINEALPNVSLSETAYDKKVYGVISSKEDIKDGNRNYAQGMFVTVLPTGSDEQRLIINSVGEGGMWVCNYSGSIENGDYITSSPIKGLGMKQNSDILHNYTVAKITQNCDFNLSGSYTEFNWSGSTYRKQFVGVTYHAG